MKNKTLVMGASENPERYSNKAILSLKRKGHEVVALGKTGGSVMGVQIDKDPQPHTDIDTVTLYLNPTHQKQYYDYILALKPRRIIFNPGTENDELEKLAFHNDIQFQEACTLVMLSTGQY